VTPAQTLAAIWDAAFERLPQWGALHALLEHNLAAHGNRRDWLSTIAALPRVDNADVDIGATIRIGVAPDLAEADRRTLREQLQALQPWRKGPFEFFGVPIDSEWRSDWKWNRITPHLSPLVGRTVLDVGCGNGYYGWRMCAAGAHCVIGIDPTLVYLMQYLAALRYLMPAQPALVNAVLPARLEDAPIADAFDTVFSMGVLYHRRDPLEHLRALRAQLRPGGELVLETLIVPGTSVLTPVDRYARMRNVWQIPDRATLLRWVESVGFRQPRVVDVTATTTSEQRTTQWMPFESLAQALDAADSSRTIEGYPAPVRAVVIAHAPP
jgi:tRNA (mo5U34)-methyltransferase